jgi:hypothetical protein
MAEIYYFAGDGSYGLVDDRTCIIETSLWTMNDWLEVENSTDSDRSFVARGIENKYLKRMGGAL